MDSNGRIPTPDQESERARERESERARESTQYSIYLQVSFEPYIYISWKKKLKKYNKYLIRTSSQWQVVAAAVQVASVVGAKDDDAGGVHVVRPQLCEQCRHPVV